MVHFALEYFRGTDIPGENFLEQRADQLEDRKPEATASEICMCLYPRSKFNCITISPSLDVTKGETGEKAKTGNKT